MLCSNENRSILPLTKALPALSRVLGAIVGDGVTGASRLPNRGVRGHELRERPRRHHSGKVPLAHQRGTNDTGCRTLWRGKGSRVKRVRVTFAYRKAPPCTNCTGILPFVRVLIIFKRRWR